jgi:hypothetical protein
VALPDTGVPMGATLDVLGGRTEIATEVVVLGGRTEIATEVVVLGVMGIYEYVAMAGFHATQRTWPMVRSQLAFRKEFQEYKSVSVIPNFVQIE